MYEQVETGPLYDQAVQLISTYRSVAARLANAKASTRGKLDRRLEKLSEKISERLGEVTEYEMLALNCWQNGIIPGTYEIDHEAVTTKPYESIRRISRWTEEYDVVPRIENEPTKTSEEGRALLQSFMRLGLD